jgi:hypothetical protein
MKRHFVPIAAVFALLLAAPLGAQSAQPPGHLDTPGSTYTNGTVVSQSADSIIIRADTGETRTYLIDGATVGVKSFEVGTRVKIDFLLDDQGRAVAKEIMGFVASADAAASDLAPQAEEPVAESDVTFDTAPESETAFDADEEMTDDELPATASPLPLIALLGAGALGSGLGLRYLRKRS